jgi:hypothetical protein
MVSKTKFVIYVAPIIVLMTILQVLVVKLETPALNTLRI